MQIKNYKISNKMENKKNEFNVQGISIPNDILLLSNLTGDEINGHFAELKSVFKDFNYPEIFPHVDSRATLDSLIELSKNLRRLKNCQGFETYIKKYNNKKELRHNYFVASLAGFLISKVDSLEFEPTVRHYDKTTNKEKPKNPDICLKLKEIEIYIEHKSINTEKFNFLDEHERIFSIIEKYLIDLPYQIEIVYKYPKFSDTDIEELGEILKEKVPSMPIDKTINVTDRFEVNVIKKIEHNKFVDYIHRVHTKGLGKISKDTFHSVAHEGEVIRIYVEENERNFGTIYDMEENYIYPMHFFPSRGKSFILIVGPKVDFSSVFEHQLEKAKPQSPVDKPYVLAINNEEMFGSLETNMWTQAIAKYTRFSGVLFVKMDDSKVFDFEFIQNPRGEFIQDSHGISISEYFRFSKIKGD